jgi:hypothetical protein
VCAEISEFTITLPDPTSYRDVINPHHLPKVTMQNITTYLQGNNKMYDDKYKKLYEERYIRYLRVSPFDRLHYITGNVWAEMKNRSRTKSTFHGLHGLVSEAQCECGAGQGPSAHCKHVLMVLYGLHRLAADGTVVTEQTCTQVLQTFHHVKPYAGEPMSIADLKELCGKSYVYDPRPPENIKSPGYTDYFRNTVLGFQNDGRMPVTQLFQPANPHALSDHTFSVGQFTRLQTERTSAS